VHPCGLCDSQEIGHGTRIWAFAHVLAGARIGRDCNICDGAFVENGASIGDRVTVEGAAAAKNGKDEAGSMQTTQMVLASGQKLPMR